MDRGPAIDRRRLGLSAAGLLMCSCASREASTLQVDVAAFEPLLLPPGEEARLDTGADANRRVTVPVRINGQGPFDFVLDTGANRTVIAAELAAALGLPDGGPANVHGVVGVEPAPTAIIGLLEADTIAAKAVRAPALSRTRLGADGLLGVDMLRNRRVLMNFVDRQLTITGDRANSEPSPYDLRRSSTGVRRDLGRRIPVPARFRFGQLIIVGADVSGKSVTAFLDSGSQSTVGNNALRRLASETANGGPRPIRLMAPIFSATGQVAEGELGPMPLLRIGGLSITGLTTVFADLHVFEIWDLTKRPSLMIGMDILGRFNAIELNYARREVAFYLPPSGRLG